nr:MAG TPA: hypothetical protein [Caudoviricetes sp.]
MFICSYLKHLSYIPFCISVQNGIFFICFQLKNNSHNYVCNTTFAVPPLSSPIFSHQDDKAEL